MISSRQIFVQDTVSELESSHPEVVATLTDLASTTLYQITAAGEVRGKVTGNILWKPTP
eukprot:SAG31_NODE_44289_length_263_cov_0.939024_1_plen_58_part_10